jgi:hypothetical protein
MRGRYRLWEGKVFSRGDGHHKSQIMISNQELKSANCRGAGISQFRGYLRELVPGNRNEELRRSERVQPTGKSCELCRRAAAKRRKNAAHGVSRGTFAERSVSPGGAQETLDARPTMPRFHQRAEGSPSPRTPTANPGTTWPYAPQILVKPPNRPDFP